MTKDIQPILNSYWVVMSRFRAGEYPGSTHNNEARRKIRWLLEQGINLVLDLTEAGEAGLKPYYHLLHEEAHKMDLKVIYKRMPIQDFSVPSDDRMVEILDYINSSLSDGHIIYLHCRGGLGRTGMMVGCYLVRHGMPGDKALEMIRELRSDITPDQGESPETEVQRKVVLEWKTGQ